ncbi:MAG: hypothetical protein ABJ263_14955 [Tateyamaria sp.]|uniref:hypothetical protein n=1 Tax=Rhodobacterales TaxID=204455 RepID=UPI003277E483
MCFGNFSSSGAVASSERQGTDDAVAIFPDENQPAPQPEPTPEPEPTPTPVGPGGTIDVEGGRVATLSVGESQDIASVRIADGPEVGNVTVNPDNTLALVLSHPDVKDFTGTLEFSYEITRTDGSLETVATTVNVTESSQQDGWGAGDFYMLQTDDAGELVIEHGDNHRMVHVSGNDLALSREEIAALENLDLSEIDGEWLADSIYGRTQDTALDDEAGQVLWEEITGDDATPGSHWLLFEKGYEYEVGRLIGGGAEGESELHPLYVGSYGEGTLPVLNGQLTIYQQDSANIVIRDISLGDKFQTLNGGNYILDGIDNNGEEISFQHQGTVTLRDSKITDTHTEEPTDGGDEWEPYPDRVSGLFVNNAQGVLLENNFFDVNGFELDYDYYASADAGQAPSLLNHNVYINRGAGDVTLRDNISLRGSSFGAQVRPGGFIEDNVFAGSNVGVNSLGGRDIDGSDVQTGEYTLYNGNVITSGGFNLVYTFEGATTWGLVNTGNQTALVDNIITHLIEPGTNPEFNENYDDEQQTQAITNRDTQDFAFNDTVIYNWAFDNGRNNSEDENIDGLDPATLDQTTIENFTADLLSLPDAELADLADFLRAQSTDGLPDLVDADVIIRYFQEGFGVVSEGEGPRDDSATLRFVPNDVGDGIRWDNRLNWDTEDLPGTATGDSVDLSGNWVIYGGTTNIEDLDFGAGGKLTLTHGYLEVEGTVSADFDGSVFNIDNAGQLWINGYMDTDLLEIDVAGGRFANTGTIDGLIDLDVSDNAQAILAEAGAELTLTDDSIITISGSDADVGFDGDTGAAATLEVETGARIEFVADSEGFSAITEFRSGHYDEDTPDVASTVAANGGLLSIDFTALQGAALEQTLIAADEIVGGFDEVEFIGLADDQDARLTVDYDSDTITFSVSALGEGSGQTMIDIVDDGGAAPADAADLWAVLTDGQGTHSDTDQAELLEEDSESEAA